MFENLMQHARVRLARRLIGRPGDIEEIAPALPRQHPIQPTATLASSYGKAIASLAELQHSLGDPREKARWLPLQQQVMLAVVIPEARQRITFLDFRIKRLNRFRQPQTDNALDRFVAAHRQS
ncbi:hypothetical protein FQZ97_1076680 [compost metagenome]